MPVQAPARSSRNLTRHDLAQARSRGDDHPQRQRRQLTSPCYVLAQNGFGPSLPREAGIAVRSLTPVLCCRESVDLAVCYGFFAAAMVCSPQDPSHARADE